MAKFKGIRRIISGLLAAAISSTMLMGTTVSATTTEAEYEVRIRNSAQSDANNNLKKADFRPVADNWCAEYASSKLINAGVSFPEDTIRKYNCTELVYGFCNGYIGKFISKRSYNYSFSTSYHGYTVSADTLNSKYISNYLPSPGELIFFDWTHDSDSGPDHVGIVESIDTSKRIINTIEANNAHFDWVEYLNQHDIYNPDSQESEPNKVKRYHYSFDDPNIYGYGSPVATNDTPVKAPDPYINFKNVSYPSAGLKAGGTFNVYGIIESNYPITNIRVEIIDSKTNTAVDTTIRSPYTNSFDLHSIDSRIWFNRANVRNRVYYYRITVNNSKNNFQKVYQRSFRTY